MRRLPESEDARIMPTIDLTAKSQHQINAIKEPTNLWKSTHSISRLHGDIVHTDDVYQKCETTCHI